MCTEPFHKNEKTFDLMLNRCFHLKVTELGTDKQPANMTVREQIHYLVFLINCYQSMEDDIIRSATMKYTCYFVFATVCFVACFTHTTLFSFLCRLCGLVLWKNLGEGALELQLQEFPNYQPHWKKLINSQG